MTTWARRCIIIPNGIVAAARNLAAALDPAGAGMFTTLCSATGMLPATHYITEGMVDANFAALLPLTTVTQPIPPATLVTITTTPGNPDYLFGACQQGTVAQKGFVLTATLADAKSLMTLGDVSEQDPMAALTRAGLKLIQSKI